jgi:hypothetical protein
MTYPWEQLPAVQSTPEPPAVADTVALLQRDVAYMVTHTAIMVHSNQAALSMLVNTARGQIVPRGECRFTDGSTFELQDIGMPQPGAPTMTVQKLTAYLWEVARELGLELAQ